MNVLIDGNIILDVLQNREPHIEASSKVWKLCETNLVNGYVSALTFADMVYVMRKELTPAKIYEVLKKLALIFHFTELSISDAYVQQPSLPEILKIISKAKSPLLHRRSSLNGSDRPVFALLQKC